MQRIVVLITLGFAFLNVYSQQYSAFFRTLDSQDGLSENHVNCILQDRDGFMWFGTNGGLNRYDGHEFKLYAFNPDNQLELRSNIIQSISEDYTGNLWIGTADHGVYRLNKRDESYKLFSCPDSIPNGVFSNFVIELVADDHGRVWFIDTKGLNIIEQHANSEEYSFYRYNVQTNAAPGELGHSPYRIFKDQYNRIWVCTKAGAYLVLQDSNLHEPYYLKYLPEITTKTIFDVDTARGNILFSTAYNLLEVEVNTNAEMIHKKVLSNEFLRKFKVDVNGNIWGAYKKGLQYYTYDGATESYSKKASYLANPNARGSLSENLVVSIEEDKTGVLWIGHHLGGVSILDPNRKKFKYYQDLNQTALQSGNRVRNIFQDSKSNIWIGTLGSDIVIVPNQVRQGQELITAHHKLSSTGEGYNFVFAFAESTIQGKPYIWLGASYPFKFGLIPLSGDVVNEIDIRKIPDAPDAVYDINIDSKGVLWAATYNIGIFRMYPETKGLDYFETISYHPDNSGLSSNIVRNIFEDADSNMWIATSSGLDMIDKTYKYDKQPYIKKFKYQADNPNSLSHNYILPIIQSADNSLWIGTLGGGVNKMKKDSRGDYHFERITTSDGLPDNMIKGLLEDEEGNIWISSNRGLSRYHISTGQIRNYDINDGLQDYEFIDLACMKTSDGELFFGGVKGVTSFYPNEIVDNNQLAVPVLTELQVLNKTIGIKEELNGRVILKQALFATEKITLFHRENSFSIKFSALHYVSPAKNSFMYMLEGFDSEWITLNGENRMASYTNLNPGNYTFMLKAANNDMYWNDSPAQLHIKIKPPIWRSKVAMLCYIVLVLVALFFFRKFSIISVQKKNNLLMEKLNKEKMEEIAQAKLNFFTYISHEIRTPLTLISAPIINLLKNYATLDDEKRVKLFRLIDRNANRINQLINQLFDYRKAEMGKLKLKVGQADFIQFNQLLANHYTEWAAQKDVTFELKSNQKTFNAWFDPDIYQKILGNLISNAIKYTASGGAVTVHVDIQGHEVTVSVNDTGVGISEEQLPRVFEMFYKLNEGNDNVGMGIGLSFVKSLVGIHHGTIWCTSGLNKGSCFSFTLPLAKDRFGADEVEEAQIEFEKFRYESRIAPPDNAPKGKRKMAVGDDVQLLLVEDNLEIISYLTDQLPPRYKVRVAHNGKEGLEKIEQKLPDLVICDIMMPIMDGNQLCAIIKKTPDYCHIPVVMLTAKGETHDFVKGYKQGADAYIAKPFSFEVLLSNMETLLRNRQLLKQTFKQQIEVNPSEIAETDHDQELLARVIQQIEDNLTDPDYRIDALAQSLGMSVGKLNPKLKALTGLTVANFIKSIRLKRAAQLLSKTDYTIQEITFKVGYNDLKYFRNCFKKEFGVIPSEYRNQSASE